MSFVEACSVPHSFSSHGSNDKLLNILGLRSRYGGEHTWSYGTAFEMIILPVLLGRSGFS